MTSLSPDPLEPGGVARFGERLRRGEITSEAATRAYLDRIDVLDPKLGAFQYLAGEAALAQARAVDALLAAGTDLGPLMGVPVAVKDIYAVKGMPTTAGSLVDVGDMIGGEGSFVQALKRGGCVILGKTKTVEFALGVTGISTPRGTPWNPWDAEVQRLPGGSSSGSAVATAAGLCGFAIGSDTGASIRVPAGFNGVFGLKTTWGLWATDGVFPLARHLDSIGPITKTAEDAAIVLSVFTGEAPASPPPLTGVRLGKPEDYFYRDLDPVAARCMDGALAALAEAGVEIVPIDVPEAPEREKYFPKVLPACLIAELGRERFLANRERLDSIVVARGSAGLDVPASEQIALETRRREHMRTVAARFDGLDGWVTPTTAIPPVPVSDLADVEKGMAVTLRLTQTSQPINYLGLCGVNIPIHRYGSPLPVGLQIVCPAGEDRRLAALSRAVEAVVGAPSKPDLHAFL